MKLFARQYIKYWVIAFIVVAVAVFAVYKSYTKKQKSKLEQQKRATDAESDRTYKVKREDLPIGLIQGGTVNASNKHKLALQANFKTKLLWVVDENSWVKKGDVLLRFETDELKQKIEDYEIDLDNLKNWILLLKTVKSLRVPMLPIFSLRRTNFNRQKMPCVNIAVLNVPVP